MTKNNIHSKNNTLNNTIKGNVKIKLNMHLGSLNGNILPITNPSICLENGLDFSCGENSQYVPVV